MSEQKITQADLDQLSVEMEATREELNRLGQSLTTVTQDCLALSQKLDTLVVRYMKVQKHVNHINLEGKEHE